MDGFVDKVGEWWRSYSFVGSPSFVLDAKLRAFKKDIIKWNREVFGDLNLWKSLLLGELFVLDGIDEGGGLYREGKNRKVEVSSELSHLVDMEETCWRQKSRTLWLKEGDRCTKFFYRVANSHRRVNSIPRLEVDGSIVGGSYKYQ